MHWFFDPDSIKTYDASRIVFQVGKITSKEDAAKTCPRPSDETIELVRDRRIEKNKSKVESEKMVQD